MTDKGEFQGHCLFCGGPVYHGQENATAVNVESLVYRSWFGQKTSLEGSMWLCLRCLAKINENLEKNAGGPINDH